MRWRISRSESAGVNSRRLRQKRYKLRPGFVPSGYLTEIGNTDGVLDTGLYRAALAAGKPDRRAMFTRFTANGVVWADGSEEAVDAVVFATGYRPSVTYLSGLGALDGAGRPLHRGGVSLSVPGLYYVGLSGQRSIASATLRGVGADAAHIVSPLRRHLRAVGAGRGGASI